jgi:hypothetical protein
VRGRHPARPEPDGQHDGGRHGGAAGELAARLIDPLRPRAGTGRGRNRSYLPPMRRPSPALIVAIVALVVACAGSATAAKLITGAQIKDRSIKGRDIGANTVTGRNVARLSGRDIIKNGLDGSDIDENTLDPVPDATHAASADTASELAKARIGHLGFDGAPGSGVVTLYAEGGLTITAECTALGRLAVRAAPVAGIHGWVRLTVTHPGSPAETSLVTDNDFTGSDAVNLVTEGADNAAGALTFVSSTGDFVTLQYLTHETNACVVFGNAVHTAP